MMFMIRQWMGRSLFGFGYRSTPLKSKPQPQARHAHPDSDHCKSAVQEELIRAAAELVEGGRTADDPLVALRVAMDEVPRPWDGGDVDGA
jgi:hypothetical protein